MSCAERADVTDLYGRYAHTFDDGDAEGFAALFAEDALFVVRGEVQARGRTAIAAHARRGHLALPGIRHLVSSTVVDIDAGGGRAHGHAYVHAVVPESVGPRTVAFGRYRDLFIDVDGLWLIAEHRFESIP